MQGNASKERSSGSSLGTNNNGYLVIYRYTQKELDKEVLDDNSVDIK